MLSGTKFYYPSFISAYRPGHHLLIDMKEIEFEE